MKRLIISIVLLAITITTSVVMFFEIKKSIEKVYDSISVCEECSDEKIWTSAENLFKITEKNQKLLQAFLKEDYVDDFYDVICDMKSAYEDKDKEMFFSLCPKAKAEIYELIMYEKPTIQNIL